MGTTALIALIKDDESILATCVSSDGYLSYTGPKLLDWYKTSTNVEKLVNQGEWGQLLPPEDINSNLVNPILDYNKTNFPKKPDNYGYINGFTHVYIFSNNDWYYREIKEETKLKNMIGEMCLFNENLNEPKNLIKFAKGDLAEVLEALLHNPNSSLYHNVAKSMLIQHKNLLHPEVELNKNSHQEPRNQMFTDLAEAIEALLQNPKSNLYHNVARSVLTKYHNSLAQEENFTKNVAPKI